MSRKRNIRLLKVISDVQMSQQLLHLILALNEKVELRCVFVHPNRPDILIALENKGVHCTHIEGGPFSLLLKLIWNMIRWRPNVLHAHLRRAKLLALPAAYLLMVKKRIHTRHSSDYNHTYHPRSVKVDKMVNRLSTDIVCISEVVVKVLIEREKVKPAKTKLIHHGFDLSSFKNVSNTRIESVRAKYDLPSDALVIGVVSRWLELKGIPYIIDGFRSLLERYPKAILLLANASGPFKEDIQRALEQVDPSSVRIIPFEEDMPALYSLMQYHVHVPISPTCEAFGQTYIESLAAGTPLIATLSGVAHEFIIHERNAIVIPYCDGEAIFMAIMRLQEDQALCKSLISNGEHDVQAFSLNNQVDKLLAVYA